MSQYRSKEIQDDESEEIDFNSNPHWIKFLNNLSSNGYFRGLLQHSKEYNTLFEAAKDFFRKSFRVSYKPNRAKELSELLDTLDIDTDELKRREKNLPEPDDEDWMNISQADLDAMLESRFGRTDDYSKNDNPDISGRLKTFINHMSEFDGADFPKYVFRLNLKTCFSSHLCFCGNIFLGLAFKYMCIIIILFIY